MENIVIEGEIGVCFVPGQRWRLPKLPKKGFWGEQSDKVGKIFGRIVKMGRLNAQDDDSESSFLG